MSTTRESADSAAGEQLETSAYRVHHPRPVVRRTVVGLVLLVLVALPLLLGAYPIGLGSRVLAFALLVVSVDLLTGVTGLPTLGQVAYFGAGAYTAGLIGIHVTTNAVAQLVAGVVVGALLAAVTGAVAVRTSGIVFLMVTLAIGELAHQAADSAPALGASNGLSGIPAVTVIPGGEPLTVVGFVYWWILAVFLLGLGVAFLVFRSPLGRSMRGVRDGEMRLRALGQNTYSVKLSAYVIAGGIAGAAGTAWVAATRFVSPGDLSFEVAAFALLAVVLGGAGSLWGPVIGAAVVILTRDWLATFVDGRGGLLLGIVFVVAVFVLPRGIVGIGDLRTRWRRRQNRPGGAT